MPDRRIRAKPGVPLVRAVLRAVVLLNAFTSDRPRLTLTELAHIAELDKGTTRRLLHTLSVAGLIHFDTSTQHYMLDIGALEIASAVQVGRDLREIASPILADISSQTSTAAFLWVPHEGAALCLDRIRAPILQIDAAWFAVGALAPLNCGAGPRVVLAFVSDDERERGLSGELPRRTPFSETSATKLRTVAGVIREQGWELAVDDFFIGLAALGVPVFNRERRFVAALSITSLTADIVMDGKPRHLDVLKNASDYIGARLYTS
ncbi:IclR family transcriptional regulator [Microvirga makkahensis]|uniref:Helix-turn-helix domain-containing protein n=1 Tax=Microvirga makkahensis TaxID=1128670 RepID=A0A7X3MUU1_9HYPH|nr:IclR family transcriptional regulator [Microvirga makkahensis]MXQ13612.1 helix-turn-helix domain-containing protein [Microvirga makkahensis]